MKRNNENKELNKDLNKKVKELSGGEKIKVLLTILLLSNPDIMLLDEPEVIRKKIMGATTDSEMNIKYDPESP